MKSTRKLLSITDLKKYFPVAKTSIFQKEQHYVRANEDISLDIYEGETIGVVGESGCGKSTLGRTLLQLYPQTAGNTMYYGVKIEEMAPAYYKDTLKNIDKYRARYRKAVEKTKGLEKRIDEAGGEDACDFFLLQSRNLARCDEQSALYNIVKIMGGFFAYDPDNRGRDLLLKLYEEDITRSRAMHREKDLRFDLEGASPSKKKTISQKITQAEKEVAACDVKIEALHKELASLRERYQNEKDFAKYEAMLDDGIDLSRLKYDEMRMLRKDLQIIFQDPYSSLNPRFTIGQIIEEGLLTHKFYKHGSKAMEQHIISTMEKCGLQDYMVNRYPHQFSGGQRQRVAIARALAVKPKFIVCDECVSALDVSIQSQIINLLQDLKETENLTYMFISHDLSVVRYISDRICVMYLGNVVELADAETIFQDPRHPYTVALLSSIPTTEVNDAKKDRILLEGNIPSPIKPPDGCKFHTRCFMACDKCKRVPPELREVEPGHFLACHFPERKQDENGGYLFEMPKMGKKTNRG